ncbi:MAG: cysteine--tRNA ligase [Acidobacteria bacterium]|nr:MAG: cysteine--tRNA ligase [Acidobacteriota bacterium]
MALRFYNTLSGRVEDFQPLEDKKVRMYTCGPTVYDFPHIGNYRTFVFQDILRRYLKYRGYEVMQAMNLTDVDDRTIANSQAAEKELREYTEPYIQGFETDRQLLSLEKPEFLPRATDHIDDMVKLIQTLLAKGHAYSSDGSVYYRVRSFPEYGKLSKLDFSGLRDGARVDSDKYDKDNARDFVLWKGWKEGEPFWEAPFGRGRPGWHIECSVMAMQCLGETLDIHSGGSDLIFPHHENEIAQSEAATGKPFVRFWLHAEHLMVNGEKMSKSAGNFFTLRDLIQKGYRPSAIRYLLASVRFRMPLNFTMDGLVQAQKSLERLRNFRYRLTMEEFEDGFDADLAGKASASTQAMEEALDDNLNTAEALAAIFNLVLEGNTAMDQGRFRAGNREAFLDALERWDRIFAGLEDNDYAKLEEYGLIKELEKPIDGSTISGAKEFPAPQPGSGDGGVIRTVLANAEIERRLALREEARGRRDFGRADEIRRELEADGVILEDTKAGTRWKRK